MHTTRQEEVQGHEGVHDSQAAEARHVAAQRASDVRAAAALEAPKHRRLIKSSRGGRMLSAVMLPFFALWSPPGYALLTTTGRKSGKRRRKCIRAIRCGERVFLVQLRPPVLAVESPTLTAAWVWNIRANPNVSLRLGLRTYSGVAREIDDSTELGEAREALGESVHSINYDEFVIHMRGFPTRAKIKEMHRYWFDTGIPIVVDLER
jgi:deazaflavin-dependent oxidoreductase (nitroreductase family)